MKVLKKIEEVRRELERLRCEGKRIGFVPTMGYLHEGHLSLVRCARRENDIVIVSIYVNPTQFGPSEDFTSYPRDLKRDLDLLEREGVDIVFTPSDEEMYPEQPLVEIKVHKLTEHLCGAKRKGHFEGVALIVLKLFNIVQPHVAYFGKKDYQQWKVIERLVKDLNYPIEIKPCPIIRERDGLAMSSRNTYLSEEERRDAVALYNALKLASELIKKGERDPERIKKAMEEHINSYPNVRKIDYIEIVDRDTLQPVERLKGRELIALAVYVGKARLIDNMEVIL